jgi:hypothetical protein
MSETSSQTLRDMILACDRQTDLPETETWDEVIGRVRVANAIHEINEETYWYFLEVLPPKWFNGNLFAFAEGQEPIRLHWRNRKRYFCRQLTQEQTDRFCETVGLSKAYGMG